MYMFPGVFRLLVSALVVVQYSAFRLPVGRRAFHTAQSVGWRLESTASKSSSAYSDAKGNGYDIGDDDDYNNDEYDADADEDDDDAEGFQYLEKRKDQRNE
jgi:hypothetical protein